MSVGNDWPHNWGQFILHCRNGRIIIIIIIHDLFTPVSLCVCLYVCVSVSMSTCLSVCLCVSVAIYHNDCMYIAHHLMLVGHQFQPHLHPPLSSVTFIDLVPVLRRSGTRCFTEQLSLQQTQLIQSLNTAHGMSLCLCLSTCLSLCLSVCLSVRLSVWHSLLHGAASWYSPSTPLMVCLCVSVCLLK